MNLTKIIDLLPPSGLDELRCADGEVENGLWLFPENEEGKPDDGIDEPEGPPLYLVKPLPIVDTPDDSRLLTIHVTANGHRNFILAGSKGELLYVSASKPGASKLIVAGLGFSEIRNCVSVGDWLAVLTDVGLLYARWDADRNDYQWKGAAPAPPEMKYNVEWRSLPPYNLTSEAMPRLEVTVDVGDENVESALAWLAGVSGARCPQQVSGALKLRVCAAFTHFMDAVRSSGLHLQPVIARSCYDVPGGFWLADKGTLIGPDIQINLQIVSAAAVGGSLHLTLELSTKPFRVTAFPESQNYGVWSDVISAVSTFESEEQQLILSDYVSDPQWLTGSVRGFWLGRREDAPLPDLPSPPGPVYEEMTGVEAIDGIGGVLFAKDIPGEKQRQGSLSISLQGWPMMKTGSCNVGEDVVRVMQSLRSLSSGQLGEFPLYAFCADGVHALSPVGGEGRIGGYRDVQLISRDVPLGADSFAPLPDATCFITSRGVIRISGTTATLLSKGLDEWPEWKLDAASRLAFIYERNLLLLYRPGVRECRVYDFDEGRWRAGEWTEPAPSRHCYAWPSVYFDLDGEAGGIAIDEAAPTPFSSSRAEGASKALTEVMIATRPLKLGSPFAVKQLRRLEAIWPEGEKLPVKVSGAMELGKWYFLGLGKEGALSLRGSGWRFFRLETYAKARIILGDSPSTTYLLPQIKMDYTL